MTVVVTHVLSSLHFFGADLRDEPAALTTNFYRLKCSLERKPSARVLSGTITQNKTKICSGCSWQIFPAQNDRTAVQWDDQPCFILTCSNCWIIWSSVKAQRERERESLNPSTGKLNIEQRSD